MTTAGFRSFLLEHERLIIISIIAVLLWFVYGKYAQIRLDHDNAVFKQAQIVAAQQVQQDAALAAQAQQNAQQIADDKAQLQALSDKLAIQNQQLIASNTALATALLKRQQTDATLPVPDLVNRWAQLAPGTNFTGTDISNNSITVTSANAVATVQQLEKVPELTQTLANETTEKTNNDLLIADQNKSIFDLNVQVGVLNASVTGLNKQIIDNGNICQDQIKVVKAEAMKSKRHWFYAGYILGFLSRQLIGKF